MDKEKARELLGQLIAIREQIERMAENGFSWDSMAEIKENLNIAIIDLENALTKRATHARNAHFYEPTNYKERQMDTIIHELITILWTPYALAGAWLLFQHIRERGLSD